MTKEIERKPGEEGNTGDKYRIADTAALERLYGVPVKTARKESDHLNEDFRRFVQQAPFVVLATNGPHGLDASAKGDAGGFIDVLDEKTLLIPERGANGRNDSLRNIVCDPRVALVFFVPGAADLLRVSGRAHISVAPHLLSRFPSPIPRSVIVIDVEEAFVQCSRAIQRSGLWSAGNINGSQ